MAEFLIRLRATPTGIVDLAGNTWSALGSSMPDVSDTKSKFRSGYSIYIDSPIKALQKGIDSRLLFTPSDKWTFSAWICPTSVSHPFACLLSGGRAFGYQRISWRHNSSSSQQPCYISPSDANGVPPNNVSSIPDSTLMNGSWHHVAVTQDGSGYIRVFFDGEKINERTESNNVDWGANVGTGIFSELNGSGNSGSAGYFDDICLIDGEALWTEDFIPPDNYLGVHVTYAYLSNNKLYTGTPLTNLTTNWGGLTNVEKEALVKSFSEKIPPIQSLATISPFRVLTDTTYLSNVKVTGQPKPQTIEPTSLINTGAVSTVQSINITNTMTDATVKFAITTDLTTYKVYDATQEAWIASTDIEEDGMSIAQINALTPQILNQLGISNGIAFKQCFIATSEDASVELSEISAVVSIDGSWSQSVHGTDYSVVYPNKTTLSVKLLTNGDYIINYPISSKQLIR